MPASEDDRVAWVARRVQLPVIPAATPGACGRRLSRSIPSPGVHRRSRRCGRCLTIPGSPWREAEGPCGTPSSWPYPSRRRPEGMIMLLRLLAVVGFRWSPLPRPGPAAVAYPSPSQARVGGPGDVTGLSAWGRCRDDPGVKPGSPVQEPPPSDLAHRGVDLKEWRSCSGRLPRSGTGYSCLPARGPPSPFQRQRPVHIPGGAAGLSRHRVRRAVNPKAFVEQRRPGLADSGHGMPAGSNSSS